MDSGHTQRRPFLHTLLAQYGSLCDFPVINPNYRGMKHRYVYALAGKRPTNFGNALAKHDTVTGEAQLWHEAGGTTGEGLLFEASSCFWYHRCRRYHR